MWLCILLAGCVLGYWSDFDETDDTGTGSDDGGSVVDDTGCLVQWCPDADRDGYGDGTEDGVRCTWDCGQVLDYVDNALDCDDLDADINPEGVEVCDGADNDCDGLTDDADDEVDGRTEWYVDSDGDDWGAASWGLACERPEDTAAKGGDCDDGEALAAPDLDEICGDGIDNDCDGSGVECRLEGNVSVGTAALTLVSGAIDSDFGDRVRLCEDLTGDGRPDLLIGARATLPDSGLPSAWVIRGGASGEQDPDDVGVQFQDDSDISELGAAIGCGADFDSDGIQDIILGAPGTIGTEGRDVGAAGIFFGPISTDQPFSNADVRFEGQTGGGHFGGEVDLRDLDGDGLDEAVITTWNQPGTGDEDLGSILIFAGTSVAGGRTLGVGEQVVTMVSTQDDTELGARGSVTTGDLDGDGAPELIFTDRAWDYNSSNADAGRVWVVSEPMALAGADVPVDDSLGIQIAQTVGGTELGAGATVGDVDGDGHNELVVISLKDNDTVLVFSLEDVAEGTILRPSDAEIDISREAGSCGGKAGDATGDIDGDGLTDLIVDGYCTNYRAALTGVVFGFYSPLEAGAHDMEEADLVFETTESNAELGRGLSAGADVDQDGVNDVLLGAPGGHANGAAYLFHGQGW